MRFRPSRVVMVAGVLAMYAAIRFEDVTNAISIALAKRGL